MAGKLEGQIAVVTGGSTGIGLAAAKRFATEGARVFVTGRRKAELDAAVGAIGPGATGVQADSANLSDLDRLYAASASMSSAPGRSRHLASSTWPVLTQRSSRACSTTWPRPSR